MRSNGGGGGGGSAVPSNPLDVRGVYNHGWSRPDGSSTAVDSGGFASSGFSITDASSAFIGNGTPANAGDQMTCFRQDTSAVDDNSTAYGVSGNQGRWTYGPYMKEPVALSVVTDVSWGVGICRSGATKIYQLDWAVSDMTGCIAFLFNHNEFGYTDTTISLVTSLESDAAGGAARVDTGIATSLMIWPLFLIFTMECTDAIVGTWDVSIHSGADPYGAALYEATVAGPKSEPATFADSYAFASGIRTRSAAVRSIYHGDQIRGNQPHGRPPAV